MQTFQRVVVDYKVEKSLGFERQVEIVRSSAPSGPKKFASSLTPRTFTRERFTRGASSNCFFNAFRKGFVTRKAHRFTCGTHCLTNKHCALLCCVLLCLVLASLSTTTTARVARN